MSPNILEPFFGDEQQNLMGPRSPTAIHKHHTCVAIRSLSLSRRTLDLGKQYRNHHYFSTRPVCSIPTNTTGIYLLGVHFTAMQQHIHLKLSIPVQMTNSSHQVLFLIWCHIFNVGQSTVTSPYLLYNLFIEIGHLSLRSYLRSHICQISGQGFKIVKTFFFYHFLSIKSTNGQNVWV